MGNLMSSPDENSILFQRYICTTFYRVSTSTVFMLTEKLIHFGFLKLGPEKIHFSTRIFKNVLMIAVAHIS